MGASTKKFVFSPSFGASHSLDRKVGLEYCTLLVSLAFLAFASFVGSGASLRGRWCGRVGLWQPTLVLLRNECFATLGTSHKRGHSRSCRFCVIRRNRCPSISSSRQLPWTSMIWSARTAGRDLLAATVFLRVCPGLIEISPIHRTDDHGASVDEDNEDEETRGHTGNPYRSFLCPGILAIQLNR
jgi:hypothetical protein